MTVTNWVEFFLLVSALPLVVTFLIARQVIGSDQGTPAMQPIAAAIKERAGAFLKRRYRTLAALLGLLLPTFAYAQPEQTGGGAKPTWCCRI